MKLRTWPKLVAGPALVVMAVACATPAAITGGPAAIVTASGETAPVGTNNEDAADDPAIWRNPENPAASLIVATDKKAGLYVYDLGGQIKSFNAGGLLNNVDLVDRGEDGILVVASKRDDPANSSAAFYRLDPVAGTLQSLGDLPTGPGEAYGLCLGTFAGQLSVFAVIKDGRIREYALPETGGPAGATLLREFSVPTQAEGCVTDPRDGSFYVGEETGGIWRFPHGATRGQLLAPIDNDALVADVEGLALAPVGTDGGWLVASSQGDNAYAVFRLPTMEFAGRFRIGAGTFGSTEETDGIALMQGDFGPDYAGGLFVAQDGQNGAQAQNFKLVGWNAILRALGLEGA